MLKPKNWKITVLTYGTCLYKTKDLKVHDFYALLRSKNIHKVLFLNVLEAHFTRGTLACLCGIPQKKMTFCLPVRGQGEQSDSPGEDKSIFVLELVHKTVKFAIYRYHCNIRYFDNHSSTQ